MWRGPHTHARHWDNALCVNPRIIHYSTRLPVLATLVTGIHSRTFMSQASAYLTPHIQYIRGGVLFIIYLHTSEYISVNTFSERSFLRLDTPEPGYEHYLMEDRHLFPLFCLHYMHRHSSPYVVRPKLGW